MDGLLLQLVDQVAVHFKSDLSNALLRFCFQEPILETSRCSYIVGCFLTLEASVADEP